MLGDPGPGLEGAAEHRIAGAGREVEDGADLGDLVRLQPLGVHSVEPVGVDAAHALPDVLEGVREVEDAALAEQEVVVQLLRQALPQLQGVLVDRRALVPQVVGADDRGVAGHVAAGQPALLQDGDVGDAVVLGEVVGGGQTVTAGADDEHVVGALRLGIAPEPVRVLRQRCGGHAGAPFR